MANVGVLHPGEMGAAIGAAAAQAGVSVFWAPEGRSPDTARRARDARLWRASLNEIVGSCEFVLSVCPPQAARSVAGEVADLGFRGIFVDANAVSPDTARAVSEIVRGGGASYVDGGIIGPPPVKPGATHLCLSGPKASEVGSLFEGSVLETFIVEEGDYAASALKMCFAAWTKGSSALLLSVLAAAEAYGLSSELREQWAAHAPGMEDRASDAARGSAWKAWRWVSEMNEIEATFEAGGLPGGFHAASAEVYERLSDLKGVKDPSVELVLDSLRPDRPGGS